MTAFKNRESIKKIYIFLLMRSYVFVTIDKPTESNENTVAFQYRSIKL